MVSHTLQSVSVEPMQKQIVIFAVWDAYYKYAATSS